MLFEIMAVVKAMQLSIMAPGLALRGACEPADFSNLNWHARHLLLVPPVSESGAYSGMISAYFFAPQDPKAQ